MNSTLLGTPTSVVWRLLAEITNFIDVGAADMGHRDGVTNEHRIQRLEIQFVGAPPAQRVARASGVSDVELEGSILRCLVLGSFQPFLEALKGYEVLALTSTPITLTRK